MKFKNYRNRFNRTNRIYSDDDIRNMKLAAIFDNENDILAQNNEIGIPTFSELQNSPNTQWIERYVNKNGENDGGYWQSIQDMNESQHPFLTKFFDSNKMTPYEPSTESRPSIDQMLTLEGGIKYDNNREPLIDKMKDKFSEYRYSRPMSKFQRNVAENFSGDSSALEYYNHAFNLAEGKEPTDFMKENNDFRKIDEINDPNLKQIYIEKAAKMYGLDINDPATYDAIKNTDVVMPKINSQLYSQVKNSKDFQKWIAGNYENIKNQTNKNESMSFPPAFFNFNKFDLFGTIHNTDLKSSKINEDGSFSTILSDAYDFENLEKRHYKDSKNIFDPMKIFLSNRIRPANNRAKEQQDLGELQRYLLSTQINLTKEEIEEILKKYRRTK